MSDPDGRPSEHRLAIGAVAQAVGIPVETLRTWERRYGLANRSRKDGGGQRRYGEEEVTRLRLVREALTHGHRAASVVSLPEPQLRNLLSLVKPAENDDRSSVESWLELVKSWKWQPLSAALAHTACEVTGTEFLDCHLGPFLRAVGEAWVRRDVSVSQEHLTSECVQSLLSRRWAELNSLSTGPVAILATFPGERHSLGLHMAAWAVTMAGMRVVFLGPDTPLTNIMETAHESNADYVVLSSAEGASGARNQRYLEVLREGLPNGVQPITGGRGFDQVDVSGCKQFATFSGLVRWLQSGGE